MSASEPSSSRASSGRGSSSCSSFVIAPGANVATDVSQAADPPLGSPIPEPTSPAVAGPSAPRPHGGRSPLRIGTETQECRGAGASCRAAFAAPTLSPNRPTPTQRRDLAAAEERQRRVEHRDEVRRVAAQRVDRALIAAGLAGCVGSNDMVSAQRKAEVARQVKRKVEDMLRTAR